MHSLTRLGCYLMQIPKVYTHYAATLLFFFFGFKTLYDVLIKPQSVSGNNELMCICFEAA